MTTTIYNDSNSLTPDVVNGFSSSRPSRNIVHAIIGSNSPSITLREAGVRQGTLTAVFASETLAHQLEAMLSDDQSLRLADTDTTGTAMRFVATGDIKVEQGEERASWLVTWDYQELVY